LKGAYQPSAAAQPGIAADRFAREIVGVLKASPSALAAAECQPVSRRHQTRGHSKRVLESADDPVRAAEDIGDLQQS